MTYAEKLTQLSDLRRELNQTIEQRAREVAAVRGTVLDFNPGTNWSRPLRFKDYRLTLMDADSGNTSYAGVDYPIAYPIGTRLIEAEFYTYVGDGYESINVTFPEEYLDWNNWRLAEDKYVAVEEAKQNEREQSAANVRRERLQAELARIQKELANA